MSYVFKEEKDMTFEEAKESVFDRVSRTALTKDDIEDLFAEKDYLDRLIKEVKENFNIFKSGDFEIYYENGFVMDQVLEYRLDIPITQEFFDDYVKHVYETRTEEEIEKFWKNREYHKGMDSQYDKILEELLKEKNNIRFDVEIL